MTSSSNLPISKILASALAAAQRGDKEAAILLLQQVEERPLKQRESRGTAEIRMIEGIRDCFGLKQVKSLKAIPQRRLGDGCATPLPGVSVVTCCMNRTENLLNALPTWLAHDWVNEVIIVDWTSAEPVADSLIRANVSDRRIHVVRAVDEPRWVLSYAFNLGFRHARHKLVLKVDADITLRPDFFHRNPLTGGTFIAGDWQAAEKGQEHINGFFFVHLVDLLRIKGFNEFITTYGWDDDDIYTRLQQSGLRRICVDTKSIYHIPHDDAQRLGAMAHEPAHAWAQLHSDTLFKIRANRYLAMVMPPWNKDRVFVPYEILRHQAGYTEVRRLTNEMPHVVSNDIQRDAEFHAALELVSWRVGPKAYHVSKDHFTGLLGRKRLEEISAVDITVAAVQEQEVTADLSLSHKGLANMQVTELERSGELITIGAGIPLTPTAALRESVPIVWKSGAPALIVNRPRLFIDAQHGLGNRLRAFASAAAIANQTDRELVLLWAPDHHCECRFADLYDYTGAVIEDEAELPSNRLRRYNYMEIEPGAVKNEAIDLEGSRSVLVRSAYVLNHPASNWAGENEVLRSLVPSQAVQALVQSVSVKNCIGVHVRMEAGKGLDHNSYDSNENWSQTSHDEIQYWRGKSHYSAFIRRIDQLLDGMPDRNVFLATDLPENYKIFQQQYGSRCLYLPRTAYDRSREQIVYALADAMLLSQCKLLLGSTWSSFSELAMRLSTTFSSVEMSGKDF
jgi:hypothetical protein